MPKGEEKSENGKKKYFNQISGVAAHKGWSKYTPFNKIFKFGQLIIIWVCEAPESWSKYTTSNKIFKLGIGQTNENIKISICISFDN